MGIKGDFVRWLRNKKHRTPLEQRVLALNAKCETAAAESSEKFVARSKFEESYHSRAVEGDGRKYVSAKGQPPLAKISRSKVENFGVRTPKSGTVKGAFADEYGQPESKASVNLHHTQFAEDEKIGGKDRSKTGVASSVKVSGSRDSATLRGKDGTHVIKSGTARSQRAFSDEHILSDHGQSVDRNRTHEGSGKNAPDAYAMTIFESNTENVAVWDVKSGTGEPEYSDERYHPDDNDDDERRPVYSVELNRTREDNGKYGFSVKMSGSTLHESSVSVLETAAAGAVNQSGDGSASEKFLNPADRWSAEAVSVLDGYLRRRRIRLADLFRCVDFRRSGACLRADFRYVLTQANVALTEEQVAGNFFSQGDFAGGSRVSE